MKPICYDKLDDVVQSETVKKIEGIPSAMVRNALEYAWYAFDELDKAKSLIESDCEYREIAQALEEHMSRASKDALNVVSMTYRFQQHAHQSFHLAREVAAYCCDYDDGLYD